jgi:uncharacterized protein YndB with AHSA1/START domain
MTNQIEKTIELNAPIDRVWRALTNHEEFGEWFRVKMNGPFVPGEEASGQILHPGYEHLTWRATIKQMEKPHLFSFTWNPYGIDPDVDYSKETPTLVEYRLRPIPTGTHLTITESGFDKVPSGRRAEAFRMNDMGWTQQVQNIKAQVER